MSLTVEDIAIKVYKRSIRYLPKVIDTIAIRRESIGNQQTALPYRNLVDVSYLLATSVGIASDITDIMRPLIQKSVVKILRGETIVDLLKTRVARKLPFIVYDSFRDISLKGYVARGGAPKTVFVITPYLIATAG